jgi:hypothetical protein
MQIMQFNLESFNCIIEYLLRDSYLQKKEKRYSYCFALGCNTQYKNSKLANICPRHY